MTSRHEELECRRPRAEAVAPACCWCPAAIGVGMMPAARTRDALELDTSKCAGHLVLGQLTHPKRLTIFWPVLTNVLLGYQLHGPC